jgi:hypothetical protein
MERILKGRRRAKYGERLYSEDGFLDCGRCHDDLPRHVRATPHNGPAGTSALYLQVDVEFTERERRMKDEG